MKLLLLVFCFSTFLAQDIAEITVYTSGRNSKIARFEKELVENVFSLFNRQNKFQVKAKYLVLKSFKEGFSKISKKQNALVINSITITEERQKKYDFSYPYLPVKNSILTSSDSKSVKQLDWQKKNTAIAYTSGTTGEAILKKESKKYPFKLYMTKSRKERIEALKSKKVNFMIGDNILSWDDPELKVLYSFDQDGIGHFGILYAKNSPWKKRFDTTLKYFLKSAQFYKLTQKIFGKEITQYFRENIK